MLGNLLNFSLFYSASSIYYSSKRCFSVVALIPLCFAITTNAATVTISSLGAADSGGAGFKTSSDNRLVFSNGFSVASSEVYPVAGTNPQTLIIKADGSNAIQFDFEELTAYAFGSNIILDTGAQIVFKNSSGGTISTKTLSSNYTMNANTDLTLADIFGSFSTVTGVAQIELTLSVNSGSVNNFSIKNFSISNFSATPPVTLTSSTYNASTGVLTITGSGMSGGDGIDETKLTLTGEGGATYTLAEQGAVTATNATTISITLDATNKNGVNLLLNKDGTSSTGSTTYNLAAAANWNTSSSSESAVSTMTVTVSNVQAPTLSTATYNASTGSLVVSGANFVRSSGNDIDVSKLSVTGQSGNSYTLTTGGVEVMSQTSFTVTLSASDKANVNGLLNKNGGSAVSSTTYNLAGAENWSAGHSGTDADTTGNTITVSNVTVPAISSAAYDASTGVLTITGTNMVIQPGANNDVTVTKFTLTGEGGATRVLTSSDVEITNQTTVTITLNSGDRNAVNLMFNKDGSASVDNTNYNLAAADDWNTVIGDTDTSDSTNVITVSNVQAPAVTSATYNASTGELVVTGTNMVSYSGATNDIDVTKLTLTGEGGNAYTLTSNNVEVTSQTSFTVTLNAADKINVNGLLNKDGSSAATSGTTFNLAAAEDWNGAVFGTTADLTGNTVTVSNTQTPTVTSATYNVTTGVLVVTGTNFVKQSGATNDIDLSQLTFTGQAGGTYTLTTASDVEITSAVSFTATLSGSDKTNVDTLLNKNGTAANDNTTYNLAAADDWNGPITGANIQDTSGNGITVSGVNDPPAFSSLDGTPTYTENGSAVVLDSNVTVSDTELDALNTGAGDYNGATLTIARNGGANAQDVYSNSGLLGTLTESNTFAYNGTTVGTVTTNSSGTLVLTFNSSATSTLVDSVLQNIAYSNSSDAPTTSVTLDWTFNDGSVNSTGTNQVTVSVSTANDAPVLDAAQSPTFAAINEDAGDDDGSGADGDDDATNNTNNQGTTVAAMVVDSSITDPDGSAVEAIAVTNVNNTNGVWQYSTDNGSNWNNFSGTTGQAVDISSSARLLDGTLTGGSTHKIRFVPNANYTGSSTITFRAWDKSSGSAGGTADTGTNGGTSAFSSVTDTASITVNGVNDVPVISNLNGDSYTYTKSGNAESFDTGTAATVSDLDHTSFNGGKLTVTISANQDASEDVLTFITTNVTLAGTTAGSNVTVDSQVIGTLDNNIQNGNTLAVTLNANATVARVQTLVQALAYQNTDSSNATASTRTISIVLNDGVGNSSTVQVSVEVPSNTVPSFSNLNGGGTYTENDSLSNALVIDSDVTISDTELDALNSGNGNYNGATLNIKRNGGANSADQFWNGYALLNQGQDLRTPDPVILGTVTKNSGGEVILTFNGNATTAHVNGVLQGMKYYSSSDNPPSSVTLDYTFNDGTTNSTGTNQAAVTITQVNDDPSVSALPGSITVTEDTEGNVDISAVSLSDPDSGNSNITLTITASAGTFSTPADGAGVGSGVTETLVSSTEITLVGFVSDIDTYLNTASNIKYTGANNASGNAAATLTLKANDGGNTGTGGGSDVSLGTVNINITGTNDAPTDISLSANTIAENQSSGTTVGTLTATDADSGDTHTFSLVTGSGSTDNGSFQIDGTTLKSAVSFDFETKSSYSIRVRATDNGTGTLTFEKPLTITVTDVQESDPPIVNQDEVQTFEDTVVTIAASTLQSNDSDPNNDPVQITAVNNAVNGMVSFTSPTINFTPSTDFNGEASFNYSLSDGQVISSGTVIVSVTAVNDAPTVSSKTVSVDEEGSSIIQVTGSDVDGDSITYAVTVDPKFGVISTENANNGTFRYTGNENFFGTDSFSFRATDGELNSDVGTVTITVLNVNDPPVANAGSTTVSANQGSQIQLSGSDVDNEFLSYAIASQPSNGRLSYFSSGDGTVIYTPNAGFTGNDAFSFTVSDGDFTSAAAGVSVSVQVAPTPVPSAPPTDTPTQTNTPLPTNTPTHTPTPSPTIDPAASPTPSPTHTETPLPTDTPTVTPTPTETATPTATATNTPRPNNHKPVIVTSSVIPDAVLVNTEFQVQLFVTDADQDEIEVTFNGDAPILSELVRSGFGFSVITLNINTSAAGSVTFTAMAYDGSDSVSHDVTINIVDPSGSTPTPSPQPTDAPTEEPSPTNTVVPPTPTNTATLVPPTFTPIPTVVPPTSTPVVILPTATNTAVPPTPTLTSTPGAVLPTPTPTVNISGSFLEIFGNTSSTTNIAGGSDSDPVGVRDLVIQWNLSFPTDDLREYHVYVRTNRGNAFEYLGQTGDPNSNQLVWTTGSSLIAPRFRVGPVPGNTYEFIVYALTISGTPNDYGPFTTNGPITLQPGETLSGDFQSFDFGAVSYNAASMDLSGSTVFVRDFSASTRDLSGGTDADANNKRGLTIAWSFANTQPEDIREYHVYVRTNQADRFDYLAKTASGSVTELNWVPGNRNIIGRFRSGPQFGNSYAFLVYALTVSGSPRVLGPVTKNGPIEYTAGSTLSGDLLTMNFGGVSYQSSISVSDDLTSTADLSGGSDTDAAGDEALVVRWSVDELELDGQVINPSSIIDTHVFASVDGAPLGYVGRAGSGSATAYEWRAGNGNIVTNAFADGPQADSTYRFAVYFILNQRDGNGRFVKVGPCFTSDTVNFNP